MKLSEVKEILNVLQTVNFKEENGELVPEHFHVTEVGVITKHFIDCGGTVRNEEVANFQLWDANDFDHRLKPKKLQGIISLSERVLGMKDLEVEVEYQSKTIGKYSLGFDGETFILLNKKTDCLAKENCGVSEKAVLVTEESTACCSSEGKCC